MSKGKSVSGGARLTVQLLCPAYRKLTQRANLRTDRGARHSEGLKRVAKLSGVGLGGDDAVGQLRADYEETV